VRLLLLLLLLPILLLLLRRRPTRSFDGVRPGAAVGGGQAERCLHLSLGKLLAVGDHDGRWRQRRRRRSCLHGCTHRRPLRAGREGAARACRQERNQQEIKAGDGNHFPVFLRGPRCLWDPGASTSSQAMENLRTSLMMSEMKNGRFSEK
jgi:hypothetical protein